MTTKELTETSQNIMIDVSKADFKKAIKAHKRFSLIGKGADQTAIFVPWTQTEEEIKYS